ncbi:MAG: hypothetical protein LBL79_14535 [Prevotella sp.]|jgi:DNA-binding HxlR family transcriptional regulator|nr:hypothetical protein [Prevotella sp.]
MITSSLIWGGPKTFDRLKELDWLEHISEYGISMYLREAERHGWVKVKYAEDKPDVYSATRKGRIMDENRN